MNMKNGLSIQYELFLLFNVIWKKLYKKNFYNIEIFLFDTNIFDDKIL